MKYETEKPREKYQILYFIFRMKLKRLINLVNPQQNWLRNGKQIVNIKNERGSITRPYREYKSNKGLPTGANLRT